jgi:hypothetical protein
MIKLKPKMYREELSVSFTSFITGKDENKLAPKELKTEIYSYLGKNYYYRNLWELHKVNLSIKGNKKRVTRMNYPFNVKN